MLAEILEILKYVLPAVVVLIATYLIIDSYFSNEQKKRMVEIRLAGVKQVTPIRLQAYERLVLFLERISPENMIMRIHKPGMKAGTLHAALLQAIRSEFEHNISQQIYISVPAWNLVKNAKEETIKMVNIAAGKVKDDADGVTLSRKVFEIATSMKKTPTQMAVDYLKKELSKFF